MFCIDDISLIENYAEAISDKSETWVCHHRLETHNKFGRLRDEPISATLLKQLRLYCNRPASELIFMRSSDHMTLHAHLTHKGKKLSEETKRKISEAEKGRVSWRKVKKSTKPYWCNNGKISTRWDGVYLPEGFVNGRLKFNCNGFKKGSTPWNKGKTGEFRHNEDTKKQISDKLKGHEPWNKGKRLSDEHKKAVSESNKGRVVSDETKLKIAESNRNKRRSDETRHRLSESHKGKHWKLVDDKRVYY